MIMKVLSILFLLLLLPLSLFGQKETADSIRAVKTDSLQQVFHSGEHDLFFMPGAQTMEQGTFAFTVYEIIFYNFTYAITSTTQIGLSFPFPAIRHFEDGLTLSAKQNVYDSHYFCASLFGAFAL